MAREHRQPPHHRRRARSTPRILLVEDHDDTREATVRVLQRQGYRVHAVATAEEALRLAGAIACDVALIDIGLPGMDGIDLLKRLREIRPLVAIAFTAYVMPNDVAKYHVARFDEIAAKPFRVDKLLAILRRVVPGPSGDRDDAPADGTVHS